MWIDFDVPLLSLGDLRGFNVECEDINLLVVPSYLWHLAATTSLSTCWYIMWAVTFIRKAGKLMRNVNYQAQSLNKFDISF